MDSVINKSEDRSSSEEEESSMTTITRPNLKRNLPNEMAINAHIVRTLPFTIAFSLKFSLFSPTDRDEGEPSSFVHQHGK